MEYRVQNTRVYLEMVESLPPAIEVLASEEEIVDLFDKLQVGERVGHSVPSLVKMYKQLVL